MVKGFFITGTDTGVGKTTFACVLLNCLKTKGYSTAALKPVATGCELKPEGYRNEDAELLQKAVTVDVPYDCVNPYRFIPAIAPHIAAQEQGVNLTVETIIQSCQKILTSPVDFIVVEGVGGFKVPLNLKETTIDLARAFNFPLILVVGLRLGCLNQALLTYDAIQNSGLQLAGWIANQIEENMRAPDENIEYLSQTIKAPLLASYKYLMLDPSKHEFFSFQKLFLTDKIY